MVLALPGAEHQMLASLPRGAAACCGAIWAGHDRGFGPSLGEETSRIH